MDVYHIQDYYALLNQIGELEQVTSDISRVKQQLADQCAMISSAWNSSTADKETYFKSINKNLDKMEKLIVALNTLGNELGTYAKKSMNIANNGTI